VLQENVGETNVMSATIRRLAEPLRDDTPIGLFYLVKHSPDDLKLYLRISHDEARTFGEPILVTSEPGYHVMNNDRVTLLASGRLLAPIATTTDVRRTNHFVSLCYLSDDGGKTWRRGRGQVDLPQRGAMEPEVFETTGGRTAMILRTQLGHIAIAYSDDGGDTWSEPADWGVQAPEAPATIRRIPATGDLLLVWNNTYTPGAGHGGKRTPLTSAVSHDDGRTWKFIRNMETAADRSFAYTSLTFYEGRALLSYYVRDEESGRISSRFRSLPIEWFYGRDEG
jgi:sialidase-1